MNYVVVAIGAMIGGLLRYVVSLSFSSPVAGSFPWSTLAINVVGSFFLGLVMQYAGERHIIGDSAKLFLTIGVIGSFTTFSTFSFETLSLFQSGEVMRGVIYIAASNALSILAAFGGYMVGKIF
ncbi:MAG: fluoride efflux transporter CrcB [Candidatus Kapaibacterium sp.]